MTVYETLSLMISFGILLVAIIRNNDEKNNHPALPCRVINWFNPLWQPHHAVPITFIYILAQKGRK